MPAPLLTRRRRGYPQLMRSRWRDSQRGMALMEALISILLFSFGLLGLMGLQASAVNFSIDAEDRNRAALLASEIASGMWLAHSVTVSPAQLLVWQGLVSSPSGIGLPNGQVTITPTTGTTNSADIVLTWKPQTDATTAANRQLTTRVILP